jgi:hypothetical protein
MKHAPPEVLGRCGRHHLLTIALLCARAVPTLMRSLRGALTRGLAQGQAGNRSSLAQRCVAAVQGIHGLLWRAGRRPPMPTLRLVAAAFTVLAAAALPVASLAACPGPEVEVRRWSDDLWWLPGSPGDATAANRGQVVNALAVRQGDKLWLIGSGPSPLVGAAIACRLQAVPAWQ